MDLSCIVHYETVDAVCAPIYETVDATCAPVVELSDITQQKILKARKYRVNEKNLDNQHLSQSGLIQDVINRSRHGIHWECYKKYTYIVSKK